MTVCNCHNCRFVLPVAIELLKEIADEGDYDDYIERIDTFLREVSKYESD